MAIKQYIIICILLFIAVSCRHSKTYEEIQYSSGELMSKGWYCADNVPVDTMYEYYKNGNVSAITVYDSNCTGKLNGVCTLFHRNGKVRKTYPYLQGSLYGVTEDYSFGGKLLGKGYILYDSETGDHYSYDTVTGKITSYIFYHGYPNIICRVDYDSSGNIISQQGNCDAVMIYRTVPSKTGSTDQCLVDMVNSNPPWRRTQINIKLFSSGKVVMTDSIINQPHFRKTYNTNAPVDSAEYSVAQFDSATGKNHYFTSHKLALFL